MEVSQLLYLQRFFASVKYSLMSMASRCCAPPARNQYRFISTLFSAALLYNTAMPVVHAESDPWILIDASERSLSVMQNDLVVEDFPGIALGRNGYSADRHQGDGKTPLGEFHVAWVNPQSRFRLFFGLDYPNVERAELAYQRKRIDFNTYSAIREALVKGQIPPQKTALGGYIGIHGVGAGDPRIHKISDWTQGCIALSNTQLDHLEKWIKVGTRVVITDGLRSL